VGWTGIQYSVYRAALAIAVAHVCWIRLPLVEGPPWPLLLLGVPGAFALSLGWRDRAVAGNLLILVGGLAAFVDGAPLVLPGADVILTSVLLLLHLFVPITPFGSWDARARIDPRGDWFRPVWIAHVSWALLVALHLERAISRWASAAGESSALTSLLLPSLFAIIAVAALVALFRLSLRPAAWIALTLSHIAWITAFGMSPGDGVLLLVHAFAADPGWWPGRSLPSSTSIDEAQGSPARLFYDGDCGFCHRSVRFILSEEAGTPDALRLRFAALQGPTFENVFAGREASADEPLPDSIVLVLEDGRALTRSAAVCEVASRLGGLWRALGLIGSTVPPSLLDRAYDKIAGVRKKIFAQPKDACPILPPDLRARFDA
jgi:predicted DCC family thiol-disulfide oxidoreductase YuxK